MRYRSFSSLAICLAIVGGDVHAQTAPDATSPLVEDNGEYSGRQRKAVANQAEAEKWIRDTDCWITDRQAELEVQKAEMSAIIKDQVALIASRDDKISSNLERLEFVFGDPLQEISVDDGYENPASSAARGLAMRTLNKIAVVADAATKAIALMAAAEGLWSIDRMGAKIKLNRLKFEIARDKVNNTKSRIETEFEQRTLMLEAYERSGVRFQRGWYGEECDVPQAVATFDGVWGTDSWQFEIRGNTFKFLTPLGYAAGAYCPGNYSEFRRTETTAEVEWRAICRDGSVINQGRYGFSINGDKVVLNQCVKPMDYPETCNVIDNLPRLAN